MKFFKIILFLIFLRLIIVYSPLFISLLFPPSIEDLKVKYTLSKYCLPDRCKRYTYDIVDKKNVIGICYDKNSNILYTKKAKITILNSSINPDYAIEITYLAQIIVIWAFTKNHQLTFGLTLNFLQTPKRQALAQYIAILLHNPGLNKILIMIISIYHILQLFIKL